MLFGWIFGVTRYKSRGEQHVTRQQCAPSYRILRTPRLVIIYNSHALQQVDNNGIYCTLMNT